MSVRQQRVIGVPLGIHNVTTSNPEENTQFRIGSTDPLILMDEVFNSSTRAVCVYGRVGNLMLEDGTFVEGPDDMIEDCLDDEFGDEEMYALAAVLPYNTSLLAVNINGVAVTDCSIVQMCRALKNTKVRLVDLTNTVIDDETGLALLELAQENIHLRTVVVDDTLIAETIMDDIDMACLNNEAMVPHLPEPVPIDPMRPRYCVRNYFGVCADGDDYCAWFHGAPPMPRRREEDSDLKQVTQQRKSLESVAALAAASQKQAGLVRLSKSDKASAEHPNTQQQQQAQQQSRPQARDEKQKQEISVVAGSVAAPVPVSSSSAQKKLAAVQEQFAKRKLERERREEEERREIQREKERRKKRKDEEAARELQQLIVKGAVAMAISGTVAWFILKKLGDR